MPKTKEPKPALLAQDETYLAEKATGANLKREHAKLTEQIAAHEAEINQYLPGEAVLTGSYEAATATSTELDALREKRRHVEDAIKLQGDRIREAKDAAERRVLESLAAEHRELGAGYLSHLQQAALCLAEATELECKARNQMIDPFKQGSPMVRFAIDYGFKPNVIHQVLEQHGDNLRNAGYLD